jgi:WD40 repeat protein
MILVPDLLVDPNHRLPVEEVSTFTVPGHGSSYAFGGPVTSIVFSHDGRSLYVGTANGQLQCWDWRAKSMRRAVSYGRQVDRFLLSPDESSVVTLFHDGSWAVSQTRYGVISWRGTREWHPLAFTGSGTVVARSSSGTALALLSPSSQELLWQDTSARRMTASQDGRWVALSTGHGSRLLRLRGKTLRTVRQFFGDAYSMPIGFSVEGSALAFLVPDAYETITVRVSSGARLAKFYGPVLEVSPTGRQIFMYQNCHEVWYRDADHLGGISTGIMTGCAFSRSGNYWALPEGTTVHMFRRSGK